MDLNNVFDTLKKDPTATKIKLEPTAMFFARAMTKTYGVKSIEVVTLEACQQDHLDELANSLDSNELPEHDKLVSLNNEEWIYGFLHKLMSVKDDGDHINMHITQEGELIKELLMFIEDETDCTLISINGSFTMDEVANFND